MIAQRAAEKIAVSKHKVDIVISYHLFFEDIIEHIEKGIKSIVIPRQSVPFIRSAFEAADEWRETFGDSGSVRRQAERKSDIADDKERKIIEAIMWQEYSKNFPIVNNKNKDSFKGDVIISDVLGNPNISYRLFIGLPDWDEKTLSEYRFRSIGNWEKLQDEYDKAVKDSGRNINAEYSEGGEDYRGVPIDIVNRHADRLTNAIKTLMPKIGIIGFFDGSMNGGQIKDFSLYENCIDYAFKKTVSDLNADIHFDKNGFSDSGRLYLLCKDKDENYKIRIGEASIEVLGRGARMVERLGGSLDKSYDDTGITNEYPEFVIEPDGRILFLANKRYIVRMKDVFKNYSSKGFKQFLQLIKNAFENDVTPLSGQFEKIFNLYLPLFVSRDGIERIKEKLMSIEKVEKISLKELEDYFVVLSILPVDTSMSLGNIRLRKILIRPEIGALRILVLPKAFKGSRIIRDSISSSSIEKSYFISAAIQSPGGIDLTSKNTGLEVRGAGVNLSVGGSFSFDPVNFQGFTFQILSIQPAERLQKLLLVYAE